MNTMEKSCPDDLTLAGWVEGTLSPQDRNRMTAHLAACDDCRRAVALASTLDAPPAEGGVNEILLSKVVSASRRRRLAPFAAAAAVLAVAVGFTLIPRNPPAPSYTVDSKNVLPAETKVAAAPSPTTEAPKPYVAPRPEPSTLPLIPEEKPGPVKGPDPIAKPVPTEEPPKKPVSPTVVDPTPAPVVVAPPVITRDPRTPPADVKTLAPVFVLDPAGDLWLKRDESEAKAGTMEKAAWKDLFAAKNSAASFTLEARTSVMLEKGSEAAFSHLKSDDTYSLALDQGLVMLDTEGSSQKWQISFPNKGKLSFSNLNGRLAVESRGDRMSALLLDGSAEMKFGALAKKAQIGEEIVLPTKEGEQVVEKKVQTQRMLARLDELRPKVFTAFATTFDEKNDELQLYPYGLVSGKRTQGPTGLYLQSESIVAQKPGEKNILAAEVHLDRAFGVVSGMVLRFRYRTTLPTFTVKIGKYSADYTSRIKAGLWGDAEIPLQAFSFEGTPMLPTDPVENVRFTGSLDKRSGQLDIDGLQFLRRVR
jgi:hypothetical protein